MIFKAGDMVRCITSISARDGGPAKGEIFKVISANDHHIGIYCPHIQSGGSYSSNIKLGHSPNWGNACFELVKKLPVKNDIEWLDRIQENFKD